MPFDNIRPNLVGDRPKIHPNSLIDPSAQIIGNVIIEKDVFVGPLTVIRADERGSDGKVMPIVIGEEVNIQDGVIIHSHGGTSVIIGARSSIAHGVTIHGPCTIGEECFLAVRATIYSATLEDHVWVGMAASVMRAKLEEFTYVPSGSIVRSKHDLGVVRIVSIVSGGTWRTYGMLQANLERITSSRGPGSRNTSIPRDHSKNENSENN